MIMLKLQSTGMCALLFPPSYLMTLIAVWSEKESYQVWWSWILYKTTAVFCHMSLLQAKFSRFSLKGWGSNKKHFLLREYVQLWYIAEHQLLTVFLWNLSPFLISIALQFADCGLATAYFKSHQRVSMGFKSGNGHSTAFQYISSYKTIPWALSSKRPSNFSFLSDGMTFCPRITSYMFQSILLSSCYRFPVPEHHQSQSITEPSPSCR